jgi:hypothetical protein
MRSSRALALWVGGKRLRPATRPIHNAGTFHETSNYLSICDRGARPRSFFGAGGWAVAEQAASSAENATRGPRRGSAQ